MNKFVRNVGIATAVIAASVLGTAGTASAFETNGSNDAVDHMQSENDGSVVSQVASEENAMPTKSVPGNIVVPPTKVVPVPSAVITLEWGTLNSDGSVTLN